jgi:cytochrome c oxidase subunit 2
VFLFGLLIVILLMVAGCSTGKQSTWDPVGPVAEKQLQLFNVLLWVMVAVFVLVEGALLYAIIRFRRQPGRVPSRTHGHLPLEITWTLVPTALILGLGIWSVVTLFDIEKPPSSEENILHVNVTGHQWWFEFEYPDAGGGKRITTANELRIPVDRAVTLNLESDDVLHSFWVPKLAGKLDIVPTRVNRMWFKADSSKIDALPATYYGQCAELCGVAHALMRFRVQVLSEDDYNAWVDNYSPPEPISPRAEAGKSTFTANCTLCHTVTGPDDPAVAETRLDSFLTGAAITAVHAPNLTDLRTRQTLAAGLVDLNAENLRKWLQDPEEVKPGNWMADKAVFYQKGATRLTDDEIDGLIEYLLQLQ